MFIIMCFISNRTNVSIVQNNNTTFSDITYLTSTCTIHLKIMPQMNDSHIESQISVSLRFHSCFSTL